MFDLENPILVLPMLFLLLLIGVFIGFSFGSHDIKNEIVQDCKTLKMFRHDQQVFICQLKDIKLEN